MVPKVIHCFWAGGGKTRLARRCLASWRRFAPGWEVHEWTLDELRGAASAPGIGRSFFEAAAAAKKWAMVSDWARMLALWLEGGVYFDLDVELVAPVDRLPSGEWVAGEWTAGGGSWMNPGGGIALEKGSAVARHMLEAYERFAFDPERKMMPWINERLAEAGVGADAGVAVLAPEVLSPMRIDGTLGMTERTVGIHRYAMGWASPWRRMLQWMSWHGFRGAIDAALRVRRAWRGR